MIQRRYNVDLAGQQAECEANYARIMRLLPDLALVDRREFGVELNAGEPKLFCFDVTERCKYTTMLDLSQRSASGNDDPWASALSFSLRIYHDAQMAEVVAYNCHRRIYPSYDYPNEQMYQRDEKNQLNNFLGEWLSHCLRYGHELGDTQLASGYSRLSL